MQLKWHSAGLLVLLSVVAVSACAPAAGPVPTAAPTQPPAVATGAVAPDPHACPQAMHGMQLFTNPDAGFCALIPDRFTGAINDTQAASFLGPQDEIEGDIAPLGWISSRMRAARPRRKLPRRKSPR